MPAFPLVRLATGLNRYIETPRGKANLSYLHGDYELRVSPEIRLGWQGDFHTPAKILDSKDTIAAQVLHAEIDAVILNKRYTQWWLRI